MRARSLRAARAVIYTASCYETKEVHAALRFIDSLILYTCDELGKSMGTCLVKAHYKKVYV